MSEFFAALAVLTFMFAGAYNWGNYNGRKDGSEEMRTKVVLYCIEKPDLCKVEYDNIKTQTKLENYKRPEIK